MHFYAGVQSIDMQVIGSGRMCALYCVPQQSMHVLKQCVIPTYKSCMVSDSM